VPAADRLVQLFTQVLGEAPPLRLRAWDGSEAGPDEGPVLVVRDRRAVRRLVWRPDEVGLGRGYVAGELDVEGDLYEALTRLAFIVERDPTPDHHLSAVEKARVAATALRLGAVGPEPTPPPEEARPRGGTRHTRSRDQAAISHHYDVGNEFYEIVLGPAMTYSCARFVDPLMTLADAQAAKHELICRKLGLHEQPGARLLDVGCGWGSMVIHAAKHHGAHAVGITISEEQAKYARQRTIDEGVADRVEIRLQDYRDLQDESFDAISSVGMFEHVGAERMADYFAVLRALLGDHGASCLLFGVLLEIHGVALALPLYAAAGALLLLWTTFAVRPDRPTDRVEHGRLGAVGAVFREAPRFWGFLAATLLVWTGFNGAWNFVGLKIVGAGGGPLLIGVGTALGGFMEVATVKTPDDVERLLGLPVIGIVPQFAKK